MAQISQGYPGGPQAGVADAAKERADFEWRQVGSQARRLMQNGDTDGAEALVRSSGLEPHDQAALLRSLNMPAGAGRAWGRNLKQFYRSGTPPEREEFEGVTGAP